LLVPFNQRELPCTHEDVLRLGGSLLVSEEPVTPYEVVSASKLMDSVNSRHMLIKNQLSNRIEPSSAGIKIAKRISDLTVHSLKKKSTQHLAVVGCIENDHLITVSSIRDSEDGSSTQSNKGPLFVQVNRVKEPGSGISTASKTNNS
jgi:hypothetical protein